MKKSTSLMFAAALAIFCVIGSTSCACWGCRGEIRRVSHALSGPACDPNAHEHLFKPLGPHSHPLRGNDLPPGQWNGTGAPHPIYGYPTYPYYKHGLKRYRSNYFPKKN